MRWCLLLGAGFFLGCGDDPLAAGPATAVSSSSGSGGSGSGASTSGTGGNVEPQGVPIFVAQGAVGRTSVSCDEGQTWIADRAWDSEGDALMCGSTAPAHCYDTPCSYSVNDQCIELTCCDHSPDVPKGVAFGDGQFVATWGWGQPGAVQRSVNALEWETTHPGDSFGGLAYGGGRFVLASRAPFWSSDGIQWTAGQEADFRNDDGSTMWSVRRFAYADYQGEGRFVAVASGDASRDMLVSSDGGESWWRPSVIPPDCANEVSTYGGIVSGNDIIVIVDMNGNACRSLDGGETWSVTPTGLTQVLSHGVFTGSEFLFWGDDAFMIASSDGANWTQHAMTTPLRLGPVARHASGALVALSSVWLGYEQQSFYRSTDGLSWEVLPATSFVASHPIFYITFGYAETCPAIVASP